ncbi:MAG: molecular chaperone DnaJ [Gemmatimonadetes bacterium]|nr:molecular chaperone DnaJ [Gemmatimonadota bacterium]
MADYYEILGVPRTADAEQIKKAYRRLAMEHHPDRNQGSEEAEARFKELSEAYETLKDPQRRAGYDRFGKDGARGAGSGPFQGGFDLNDAVETFMRDFGGAGFGDLFGGARRRGPAGQSRAAGETLRVRLPITLREVVSGATKRIRLAILEPCGTCSGSGSADSKEVEACRTCGGTGEERIAQRSVFGQFVSLATCRTCRGEGRIVRNPCTVCHGEGRVRAERDVEIEVPPGVSSENFISLRGRGNVGPRGGPRGDIVVLLEVEEDDRFIRDGTDLVTEIVVSFAQAALGAEVEVPVIEGSSKVDVPPGVQSGQAIRIRGEGLPELHGAARGDLVIRVRVWTPTKLSREQRESFERLREVEAPPPERVEDAEAHQGFWSKLREAFT